MGCGGPRSWLWEQSMLSYGAAAELEPLGSWTRSPWAECGGGVGTPPGQWPRPLPPSHCPCSESSPPSVGHDGLVTVPCHWPRPLVWAQGLRHPLWASLGGRFCGALTWSAETVQVESL